MKNLKSKLALFKVLILSGAFLVFFSCGNENEVIDGSKIQSNENFGDLNESQIESMQKELEAVMEIASKKSIPEDLNIKERLSSFDLSMGEIENLTTEDLLKFVVNYEYLPLLFVKNDLQSGFDGLAENFQGLTELLDREDLSDVAIKHYAGIDILDFTTANSLQEKGAYALKVLFMETLLAQKPIVKNYSKSQSLELAKKVLKNMELKSTDSEVYGFYSNMTAGMLVGRILENDSNSNFSSEMLSVDDSKEFIEKGHITSKEVLEHIFTQATIKYLERN